MGLQSLNKFHLPHSYQHLLQAAVFYVNEAVFAPSQKPKIRSGIEPN